MLRRLSVLLCVAIVAGILGTVFTTEVSFAKPLSYSVSKGGIYSVSEWYNMNGWPKNVTRWGKITSTGKVKTIAEFPRLVGARGAVYDAKTKLVYVINHECYLWSFSPRKPHSTIVNRGQLRVNHQSFWFHECLTIDVTEDGDIVTSHGNVYELFYGTERYTTEIFDPATLEKIATAPVALPDSSDYFLGYSAQSSASIITVDEKNVVQTWTPTLETTHTVGVGNEEQIVDVTYDSKARPWLVKWRFDGPDLYINLGIYSTSSGTVRWGRRLGEGKGNTSTWWTNDVVFVPNR